MKSLKIKLLSVLITVCLLFSVFGVFALLNNKTVVNAQVVIENWSQEQGANLGDLLDVPTSVKIKIDEQTYINADNGIIYFPDGNAKPISNVLLDKAGKYTLEYRVQHAGQTVVAEKSFVVKNKNYYVTDEIFSSATFKAQEEIKNGEIMGSNGANRADGIELVLTQGESFTFGKPVNIYELAAKNEGKVNLLTVYPEMDTSIYSEDKFGKSTAGYFIVKLIDCYDANNFVEIYIWNNHNQYYDNAGKLNKIKNTYAGAGTGEQRLCGLNTDGVSAGTVGAIEINGSYYAKRYSDRYATVPWGAYITGGTNSMYSNGGVTFTFDVNENQVYYKNILINDLDDLNIYPDNPFKGFTTGEVTFEFSFEKYVDASKPSYAQITAIGDINGEMLQNFLVEDKKAPQVNIDVEYTDKANKTINVSYNEQFTLPTANVYDVNGKNEYKLAVYYDYYTDNPKAVYLKDGKFTPDKMGVVYTATYSAVDNFGNKNVDANGKCKDVVNIIPVVGKKFAYAENKVSSLNGGEICTLPKITVQSKNTLNETRVFAVEPTGKRVEITSSLNGENYSFMPECLGEYTIEYFFSDNVYSETFSYKVQSVNVDAVLFNQLIAVPSVFIKDAIYDLNDYYAEVVTANGLEKKKADILVSVDGGEYNKISNPHKFKIEGNNSLSFKVEYGGKQSSFVANAVITDVNYTENASVNNGSKIYENYFVGYDSVIKDESSMQFAFNGNETETLTFATPLVFDAFKLEFEIDEKDAEKFSSFSIILREIASENKGYILTYTSLGSATIIGYKIHDFNGKVYFNGSVTGKISGIHTVSIQNGIITVGEGKTVGVDKTTSRNIEFLMQFSQVSAPFSIKIRGVCGTAMTEEVYEMAAQLVYTKPLGFARVGEEYVLPYFNVMSVFHPISLSNLTYSFKDASGNVLVDKNGTALENVVGGDNVYTVIPQEVKQYKFIFNYDNYGSALWVRDYGSFVITVIDTIDPVIEFNDKSNEQTVVQVKLGATHKIKEFTFSDNVTPNEDLIVKVMIEVGVNKIVGWDVKEEFTFNEAGEYKVVVICQDKENNMATRYYKVIVK